MAEEVPIRPMQNSGKHFKAEARKPKACGNINQHRPRTSGRGPCMWEAEADTVNSDFTSVDKSRPPELLMVAASIDVRTELCILGQPSTKKQQSVEWSVI